MLRALNSKFNKYDYGIMLLIAANAAGGLFAPLTIIRLISILLIPYLLFKFEKREVGLPKYVNAFFIVWFLFSILSLGWTPDISTGAKTVFYNISSFIVFASIWIFYKKGKSPYLSIIFGWSFLFLFTFPTALNEFINNVHLEMSFHEGDNTYIRDEFGQFTLRHFASVTFGNLNGYNVVACYCLLFVLAGIVKDRKYQLFGMLIFFAISFVIIMNASRGAFLCLGICVALFIFFLFRQNKIRSIIFLIIILAITFLVVYYYNDIFSQISTRIISEKLTEDESRSNIYEKGLILFRDTDFMGTGIGGLKITMERMGFRVNAMHNMFFEFLFQYGIIPFIFFILMLYKITANLILSRSKADKFLGWCFLVYSIPLFIINSGYLEHQSLWAYLASLLCFSQPRRPIPMRVKLRRPRRNIRHA